MFAAGLNMALFQLLTARGIAAWDSARRRARRASRVCSRSCCGRPWCCSAAGSASRKATTSRSRRASSSRSPADIIHVCTGGTHHDYAYAPGIGIRSDDGGRDRGFAGRSPRTTPARSDRRARSAARPVTHRYREDGRARRRHAERLRRKGRHVRPCRDRHLRHPEAPSRPPRKRPGRCAQRRHQGRLSEDGLPTRPFRPRRPRLREPDAASAVRRRPARSRPGRQREPNPHPRHLEHRHPRRAQAARRRRW